MPASLDAPTLAPILGRLHAANAAFAARYPGEGEGRQPVHTVYGGAQLFKATTARNIQKNAIVAMREYAPDFAVFARALGLKGADTLPTTPAAVAALADRIARDPVGVRATNEAAWLAWTVHTRVAAKLDQEAVEDFRIDFEDGYGNRPDAEEDKDAERAAREVAAGMQDGALPPFIGIRIKPFTDEMRARSVRTLDLFVTTLVQATGGRLPANFCITLPKIQIAEQATALVELLAALERANGMPSGALKIELMAEVTQAIIGADGKLALPAMVQACAGRCVGVHFGTYDYTASCSITAAYQTMAHAVCDFAKHVQQVSLGGMGIPLSDGATNVMPVGPHRARDGEALTIDQLMENRAVVHRAWRLAYDHIWHSLRNGYYQGWDLHPAQLPVRYAAMQAFFLDGLDQAAARMKAFIQKAAQATLVGDVFDDAATGQGLLNYFLRALNCGALQLGEIEGLTGLTVAEIRGRSFRKIVEGRRGA
ncbi:MAG: phosphoenolpyruvate kinase [Myxococcales bacterium]|nr:phosphoenolpyruvate kinase [Myxococcales bacterium]